jgi:hypothetical protein
MRLPFQAPSLTRMKSFELPRRQRGLLPAIQCGPNPGAGCPNPWNCPDTCSCGGCVNGSGMCHCQVSLVHSSRGT